MKCNFFERENPEFSGKFTDKLWCAELAYLPDIFLTLSTLNASMRGGKQNLIPASNKTTAFSRK
jgi:hypothetical protein